LSKNAVYIIDAFIKQLYKQVNIESFAFQTKFGQLVCMFLLRQHKTISKRSQSIKVLSSSNSLSATEYVRGGELVYP